MRYLIACAYWVFDFFRWPELKKFSNYESFCKERHQFFESNLKNTPFYSGVDKEYVLTKDDLASNSLALRNSKFDGIARENTSGGSTGRSSRFYQDKTYDRYVSLAMRFYYQVVVGIDIRPMRKVTLWGSEYDVTNWSFSWRSRLRSRLTRNKLYNSFNMNDTTCGEVLTYIKTHKVELLRGYGSSLEYLADYCIKMNESVFVPYIVSSAEKLETAREKKLAKVFGGVVLDIYGSREAGMMAGRCSFGNYHFIAFNHHVEFEGTVDPNIHNILVSTLNNAAMPLKRFLIGDQAKGLMDVCECGRPGPVAKSIKGRLSDNFCRKDGSVIHGEFFTHLIYGETNIKRFQFRQVKHDTIELNLEVDDSETFIDVSRRLHAKLLPVIEAAMRAPIEFTILQGGFLANKSGKHLYTICSLTEASADGVRSR